MSMDQISSVRRWISQRKDNKRAFITNDSEWNIQTFNAQNGNIKVQNWLKAIDEPKSTEAQMASASEASKHTQEMQISTANENSNQMDIERFMQDLNGNTTKPIPSTAALTSDSSTTKQQESPVISLKITKSESKTETESSRHTAHNITLNNIEEHDGKFTDEQSIHIEKKDNKETIIIDSIPNRDTDNIKCVKVKILVPWNILNQMGGTATIELQNLDNDKQTDSENIYSEIGISVSQERDQNQEMTYAQYSELNTKINANKELPSTSTSKPIEAKSKYTSIEGGRRSKGYFKFRSLAETLGTKKCTNINAENDEICLAINSLLKEYRSNSNLQEIKKPNNETIQRNTSDSNRPSSIVMINNALITPDETENDDVFIDDDNVEKEQKKLKAKKTLSRSQSFKNKCNYFLKKFRSKAVSSDKPVMGKTALLVKSSRKFPNLDDSEIVEDLVTERFGSIVENQKERSMRRQHNSLKRRGNKNSIIDTFSNEEECDISVSAHNDVIKEMNEANIELLSMSSASAIEEMPAHVCSLGSLADAIERKFQSSRDVHENPNNSPVSEYDQQQFLRAALGSEYLSDTPNVSVLDADVSIGSSKISELVSMYKPHDSNTVYNQHLQDVSEEDDAYQYEYYEDEPTYNSDGMYPVFDDQAEYDEILSNEQRLSELIRLDTIQNQIIKQTSKALTLCKTTKEFMASPEEVEAERILLIATIKHEALKKEIRKVGSDDMYGREESNSYGSIKISGITLPIKVRKDKRKKDFTRWYVCIVSCGIKIFATRAVRATADDLLKFTQEMIFDHLDANFEINVAIYSILIKNNLRTYSHESKYRLNKVSNMACPTFFKITHNSRFKAISDEHSYTSSFALAGKCTLRIPSLKKDVINIQLADVAPKSLLEGTAFLSVIPRVVINENHSDFLNVGSEVSDRISWNRRWCCMEGHTLFYYNYPGEQTPVGCMDLRNCISSKISLVDRRLCSKSKTLFLECSSGNYYNDKSVVKHFLAADSVANMEIWKKKLNSTISCLRNWNSMNNRYSYSEDDDLDDQI